MSRPRGAFHFNPQRGWPRKIRFRGGAAVGGCSHRYDCSSRTRTNGSLPLDRIADSKTSPADVVGRDRNLPQSPATSTPSGNTVGTAVTRDEWDSSADWTLDVNTGGGGGSDISVGVSSSGSNASSGYQEITVQGSYTPEYMIWLDTVEDPIADPAPDGSFSETKTTVDHSDEWTDSTNTVTINGSTGGHDFDVTIDGTFTGGSYDRKLTDKTKVEDEDGGLISESERIETWKNNSNSGSMTIDVTGSIGESGDDFSGTFEMHATMNTGGGRTTHEVKEDDVLTFRDNTTTHGNSSNYTIELDLSGDGFDLEFEGNGGNSMSGTTTQ